METCKHDEAWWDDEAMWCPDCNSYVRWTCPSCNGDGSAEVEFELRWLTNTPKYISGQEVIVSKTYELNTAYIGRIGTIDYIYLDMTPPRYIVRFGENDVMSIDEKYLEAAREPDGGAGEDMPYSERVKNWFHQAGFWDDLYNLRESDNNEECFYVDLNKDISPERKQEIIDSLYAAKFWVEVNIARYPQLLIGVPGSWLPPKQPAQAEIIIDLQRQLADAQAENTRLSLISSAATRLASVEFMMKGNTRTRNEQRLYDAVFFPGDITPPAPASEPDGGARAEFTVGQRVIPSHIDGRKNHEAFIIVHDVRNSEPDFITSDYDPDPEFPYIVQITSEVGYYRAYAARELTAYTSDTDKEIDNLQRQLADTQAKLARLQNQLATIRKIAYREGTDVNIQPSIWLIRNVFEAISPPASEQE